MLRLHHCRCLLASQQGHEHLQSMAVVRRTFSLTLGVRAELALRGCRAPDAATPPPPPPPPPPGFSAGPERPQPISAARAPSRMSDDGFKAPSSPMVDPEEGHRDRCALQNATSTELTGPSTCSR